MLLSVVALTTAIHLSGVLYSWAGTNTALNPLVKVLFYLA